MKKILSISLIMLFCGCSPCSHHVQKNEDQTQKYSRAEVLLSDFSKKIVGYYASENRFVPENFDEKQFIDVLVQTYPDQSKVNFIMKNFKIKVRRFEDGYSVVLCDPDTDNKILEDAASSTCSLNYVEMRFWDKKEKTFCSFESNLAQYCK